MLMWDSQSVGAYSGQASFRITGSWFLMFGIGLPLALAMCFVFGEEIPDCIVSLALYYE